MKAAHRRWHPRLWLVVAVVAIGGLALGLALRRPSPLDAVQTAADGSPGPAAAGGGGP